MEVLNILFVGESNLYQALESEVIELGHRLKHVEEIVDEAYAYSFIIFVDQNVALRAVDQFPDILPRVVLRVVIEQKICVLNLKSTTDAYRLEMASDVVNEVEILTDALITLSKANVSNLEIIKFSLAQESKKDILSRDDYQNIVYDWNKTDKNYLKDKTISQLFEEQVEKTPDKTAIVFEEKQLTYKELNTLANQLARHIRKLYKSRNNEDLKADTLIALCLDRSLEIIIAILGTLKAGAAYVPIDPSYPKERIQYILDDIHSQIVLTQTHLKDKLTGIINHSNKNIDRKSNDIYQLVIMDERDYQEEQATNLPQCINYTDLAYVIYTSGTTGNPKGVMIEHGGLVNLVKEIIYLFEIDELSVSTQYANFVFDASVCEIFPSLTKGAKILIINSNQQKDIESFLQLVKEEAVNLSYIPGPILKQILSSYPEKLTQKVIFTGGSNLNGLKAIPSSSILYNQYGLTEATVCSTHTRVISPEEVNIGKPISNTQVYVLDEQHEPVSIGVVGELYIGGVGLARGYLNNPKLTTERFIPNPFATEVDKIKGYKKLYKTGDLVKWLPDGNLEYIGRNDFQVKIRGYRVELGEIESTLLQHPVISEVVVLLDERAEDNYLVTYYTASEEISNVSLKNYLADKLPDYMIPNQFIKIDIFPLTINGKLDRNALSSFNKPVLNEMRSKSLLLFTDPIEEFIASLWYDLLPIANVHLDCSSNFLNLGGHSLLFASLVLSIEKKYGVHLKVIDLLENLEIRQLASVIKNNISLCIPNPSVVNQLSIDNVNRYQPFELTEVQHAYLVGREKSLTLGGISTHIYLEFLFKKLDLKRFEQAWNKLLMRHDALRTEFKNGMQTCLKSIDRYQIRQCDYENARQEMSHQIFNPENYPLFDIRVSNNKSKTYIHFSFDALITDVYSLKIIFSDLIKLYRGEKLAKLSLSFRDYVIYEKARKNTKIYHDAQQYWLAKLPKLPLAPQLPLLKDVTVVHDMHFSKFHQVISCDRWEQLKKKSIAHKLSPTSIVLTLYGMVLSRFGRQKDILLNITLFNRTEVHPEVNALVGDFTTLELFGFIRPLNDMSIKDYFQKIQNDLWNDLEHRIFSGMTIASELRKLHGYTFDYPVAPYVFTSAIGHDIYGSEIIDKNYLQPVYEAAQTSQCLLDNIIREIRGDLHIDWYYLDSLLDENFVAHMFSSYIKLIDKIIDSEWSRTIEYPQISIEDKKIIKNANHQEQSNSKKTLVNICLEDPKRIAVIDASGEWNYQEILNASNNIAYHFHLKGVNKGELVGVLSEKGALQVVATLGVMKSGAGYLPLHIDWPIGRIDDILQEGLVKQLLVSRHQWEVIQNTAFAENYQISLIEDLIVHSSEKRDMMSSLAKVDIDDVAYVIFTSGTTNKPKGVTISHKGAVNTIEAINKRFNIGAFDKVLALSELSFDLSVYDIFGVLSAGGTIVFPDQERIKEPKHWYDLITQHQITIWNSVPQVMQLLIDYVNDTDKILDTLKVVLMSGDWIPVTLPEQIKMHNPRTTVMSLGGATEGSIWSIWYEIDKIKPDWTSIPYGYAMPNQKMYVLNSVREHCPIDVIGEIYIGGEGVALGYWNDEEKSNTSFIQHKLLGRLYKTGDLGKWNNFGYMTFEGREDQQVKLNGYRVELEEISSRLKMIEDIEKSLVIIKNNQLIAYLITNRNTKSGDCEQYKSYLSRYLPAYMLPNHYIRLEKFPLTSNGKLDRNALPEPDFANKDSFVAPRTDLQIRLCHIWKEILNVNKVGITDDFFRIGGDSILAIKLSHQIRKLLDYNLAIADIFKYKTILNLVDHLSSNDAVDIVIRPKCLEQYPLSFAQERLWFIEQYEQGTNAYHFPILLELQEGINKDKLKNAIQQVIQRHEVLRTVFKQEETKYYQIAINHAIHINEYSHIETNIDKQLEKEIQTPFNLQKEFPIRISFYDKKNANYLLVNVHHIAFDGWSLDVFFREINALYYGKDLPALPIHYKDFSVWQREYLQGKVLEKQLSYWLKKLQGYEPLALSTDKLRPRQISYLGDDVLFSINQCLSTQLRALSREQGCSVYAVLLSGFYILLNKYSGQNDIVLGTPIANRHYSEIQDLIGFFVNSLALRENIDQECNVLEFISQVQHNLIAAQKHQDLPFEKLVEELKIEKDTSRHPIFQVVFSVQSFGDNIEKKLFKDFKLNNHSVAKFDFSCFMDDSKDEIQGLFNFATSLFMKSTIERMVNHYLIVLDQMVNNQEKQIKDYCLLSKDEYQQLVIDWNQTDKEYPKDKTVYQLFEAQVSKEPANIAIIFEEEQLTYAELNVKSNQVARYLQTQTSIKSDTIIGLCLDKGLEMIIGILGILKSGAAYLPIDPEYPSDRIYYLLEDSQTKLVLTQSHLKERLEEITDINLVVLDSNCYENQEAKNLEVQNKTTDLAYVIYTSGSTGKPKGVCVSHESLNNLIFSQKEKLNINNETQVLQFASIIFDASVWEIFSSLAFGAKLNIVSNKTRLSMECLNKYISTQKINLALLPPTILNILPTQNLECLKYLLTGGDNCNDEILAKWNRGRVFINAYGPTESAVCATMHEYKDGDISANIGKALNNIKCYVLDSNKKLVPIGVIGELYISGASLAREYLNKPKLTAEQFIVNSFATEEDILKGYTRLYKTGDLVRWLPEGNLEYVGREDFQVKIRGYRIELGEIENALISIEHIKQAVVLVKEEKDNKRLIAYFVSDLEINQEHILNELSAQLPNYMVPIALKRVDSFPLTANGKLNIKALPEPDYLNKDRYIAPTTDLQLRLCQLWQEILNLDKVGIGDDFFRIGGDSILSIQLSSRLRKHDLNCSVRDIFEYRTIQKLSMFIVSGINKTECLSEQGILKGEFDLLPIQKWFFYKVKNKEFKNFNHWNQSFIVKVPKLEIGKLQDIIQKLTEQHDILRAVYTENHQEYLGIIDIPQLKYLNIENLTEETISDRLTDWQSHFNVKKGPLWNVAYIEGYKDQSARLFFALHHLIVDSVSWRILIEDFKSLYHQEKLKNKLSSYRQWVNELLLYPEKNAQEKNYWGNVLKTMPQYNIIEKGVKFTTIKINKEKTRSLLKEANKAYHTEVDDLLLTAIALALQSWNKESTQVITLERHGRENIYETIDHSKTVGWFTTMYPVRLALQENLEASIQHIKESLRAIPNKGIGFGVIFPNELMNLPPISFNYLGQFDTQDAYWHIVSENSGIAMHTENIDTNIININGWVLEGELRFSIVTKLGEKNTMALANNFQHNLEEIILHCKDIIDRQVCKYTPSDFSTINISQALLNRISSEKDNQIEDIYLANSLQQGFIYHALSQPEDDAYRVQTVFDYMQELNIEDYVKSWELTIKKYPILRTAFNWEEEVIQIIYLGAKLNCQILDINDFSKTEKEKYIIDLQAEDRNIPFDLTKPCLLRLYIIKQAKNYYTIIKSAHHSVLDGWSEPLLLSTIHQNYYDLQKKNIINVVVDNAYLETQRHYAKNRSFIEKYWQAKISTIQQANDLSPLLSQKKDLDDVKYLDSTYDVIMEITGELYLKIKELIKSEGLTLNTLVQFAWHKLIQIYTQDSQTIVGTIISGRDLPILGIEESVGLHINTLPLIINWDNQNTVLQQIKIVHQEITDINAHSFANLTSLQQNGKRLFHSLFIFENYPLPKISKAVDKNILISKFRYTIEKLNYPLSILAYEQENKLVLQMKSDRKILSEEKANYNLGKIKLLLSELLHNLNNRHNNISSLTHSEYEKIVVQWNQTDKDYPKDKTIHQLFEEQASKTPSNVAVVFEGQHLTYAELNAKANQFARFLQSQKCIKQDASIALCLDRGLELIIAILGVLKAGSVFVPIDTSYPNERISYMLEDTNSYLLVTQPNLMPRLEKLDYADISLITFDSESYTNQQIENLPLTGVQTAYMYVLYTSGTTGKPKGSLLLHTGFVNLISNFTNEFDFNDKERCLIVSSFSFDLTYKNVFSTLCTGGELHITSSEVYDACYINEYIKSHYITSINCTPSGFYPLIEQDELNQKQMSSLKWIFLGGEPIAEEKIIKFYNRYDSVQVVNTYGPTECTDLITYHRICRNDLMSGLCIPLGKPIPNTRAYVLNPFGYPVPIGVAGELHIGGAGVSNGYLNRPEINKAKFIKNTFASRSDNEKGYTRLYKTGDFVRWLSNGYLEYIGRNDFQVKIRGLRIELGEIEQALSSYPEIKQACVLVRERETFNDEDKYLVGYYISSTELSFELLSIYLSKSLPNYMIPNYFVRMDSFPLTVNGKLDRRALPSPVFINETAFVAPTTDLEIKLCQIWKEVLNLEKVGVTDNFFRIGGNSILAIKLAHQIKKSLSYHIAIADILKYSSIHMMSNILRKSKRLENVNNEIWEI